MWFRSAAANIFEYCPLGEAVTDMSHTDWTYFAASASHSGSAGGHRHDMNGHPKPEGNKSPTQDNETQNQLALGEAGRIAHFQPSGHLGWVMAVAVTVARELMHSRVTYRTTHTACDAVLLCRWPVDQADWKLTGTNLTGLSLI